MIVTRSGKWNERASGGSVLSVAAYRPTGFDDVPGVAAHRSTLIRVAITGLPLDDEVNFFASAQGSLQ